MLKAEFIKQHSEKDLKLKSVLIGCIHLSDLSTIAFTLCRERVSFDPSGLVVYAREKGFVFKMFSFRIK
jgi:hypothetical protein